MCGYVKQSIRDGIAARQALATAERINAMPFKVVRLNAKGAVNKAVPTTGHATLEQAQAAIAKLRSLNPGKTLRYAINGEEA